MQIIPVRDILKLPKEQLFMSLPDKFQISFDDNLTIDSTKKQAIYSNYFWDIHRAYPNAPLLSRHHVTHVLKGKPLTSDTHIDLLSIIFEDITIAYGLHMPEDKEHLLGMVYEVTNNIHNEVSKLAEGHVISIDILDFIEVIDHPGIKHLVDNTQPSDESITGTYAGVLKIINTDPILKDNSLVMDIRSKMVNANQVLQCVSIRGFCTEVDGSILPTPVFSNYVKGIKSLHNFVATSREAAKSLYFSETPLQDAEYFARRLQLLSMTVERISYTDCGSDQYLNWRVSGPTIDERGKTIYPGDLAFMLGKYYLDEETGKLKEITHNDPALHHKVLKIRSVLFCKHPDKHSVCEVCFGGLSKNISRFTNLGHLCSATMTQQTSQSVLSTKHLDASSVSASILLGEVSKKYLVTNRLKNAYLIKKELKDKNVRMIISREEVVGLIDILNIDNVENISPSRVSRIECIELLYMDKNVEVAIPLYVSQGNRYASLTTEFLKYLKVRRWDTDSRNNFVFDLDEWNFSLPIMGLPDMEYSFSDHSHQIARVIESNMENITERASPHSPVATLQELFGLVNTKLNVNIAALEVIIYSAMLPAKDEYDMARSTDQPVLGIADLVIKNRSLAAGYAYEYQCDLITNPRSFFKLDRPDSVFDVFICPNEVVEEYKGRPD